MSNKLKEDQMTPKERQKAFYEGKPYDRIPCVLAPGDYSHKLIGAKVSEIHLSVNKIVEAQIASYKAFEIQSAGVGPGLHGIAEAIGSKLTFPKHGAPYIEDFAVKDYSDLDRLEIPDPSVDGRLPLFIEAVERINELLGDKLPIIIGLPGPFTTAANIRGTDKLMRDLYHNPEFAHKLLDFSLKSTIAFVEKASQLDVNFGIADPTASGTLISQKHFHDFAFPYLKKLIDVIIRLSTNAPSLHICGNTKKIWQEMANTGAGTLSLDDVIDLEEAKKEVGNKVVLSGNIKPTETMYLGTPSDVEENAKVCLRKAYDNPKGYILGLGCGMPIDTPPENIRALLYSARKYGQYPLNPSNFGEEVSLK